MKKNIVFYFSDQQRWDTVNKELTPNLMKLAENGVFYEHNYTCQPVCGPARACLQTGQYASQNGCLTNGVPLPTHIKPLAEYFKDSGYQTGYIGKWHLASNRYPGVGAHYEKKAVPKERRGGYEFWRGVDLLEFTSHGYDGYVYDENNNKCEFKGYRADCINDYALEFIEKRNKEKPFFLFVSQLEPHHQNNKRRYEGYKPTVKNYENYPIPTDLQGYKGNYREMYPDYLSAINRLDYNIGLLIDKLKEENLLEDTVIIYTSDHGCHFKTRSGEYKRNCHDSCIRTPLIISGGNFKGGKVEQGFTSLIDLPSTMLAIANIEIPQIFAGKNLQNSLESSDNLRKNIFVQISENGIGRAIRTKEYKYSVKALVGGLIKQKANIYVERYLYDLMNDPDEKHNLIKSPDYKDVRLKMRQELITEMIKISEKEPMILPAISSRNR